jgi:Mn-containing catalase
MRADIRKTLSESMKNIAQAIKNQAGADAANANTALAYSKQEWMMRQERRDRAQQIATELQGRHG